MTAKSDAAPARSPPSTARNSAVFSAAAAAQPANAAAASADDDALSPSPAVALALAFAAVAAVALAAAAVAAAAAGFGLGVGIVGGVVGEFDVAVSGSAAASDRRRDRANRRRRGWR